MLYHGNNIARRHLETIIFSVRIIGKPVLVSIKKERVPGSLNNTSITIFPLGQIGSLGF